MRRHDAGAAVATARRARAHSPSPVARAQPVPCRARAQPVSIRPQRCSVEAALTMLQKEKRKMEALVKSKIEDNRTLTAEVRQLRGLRPSPQTSPSRARRQPSSAWPRDPH